ncbi:MAG: glycosyltransferase family 4 protein [Deltaproteobacteria bacterium]|nr:glycosyltransferase family 4 protein [Deltaproteobacteria bacterium]
MHILCITPMYPEAKNPAFGIFIHNLNQQLSKQSHTIEVLHRPDGDRGIFSYLHLLFTALRYALQKSKPDIIHGHYLGPAAFIACLLGILKRCPVVLTAHGSDIEAAKHRLIRIAWRLLFFFSAGIHFVSKPLMLRAQKLIGPIAKSTLAWPLGIDTAVFQPHPLKKITSSPLQLLCVGRLSKEKGWDDTIAAIARLRDSGHDVVLTACADGDRRWFHQLLNKYNVASLVTLTGFQPPTALAKIYALAHLLLVPSWREGFGLVGLEAMAVGTPIITTGVGGMGEYIRDSFNALVIPVHNPVALADAVLQLANDQKLYSQLYKGGLQTAGQYSVAHSAEKITKFFQQIINSIA